MPASCPASSAGRNSTSPSTSDPHTAASDSSPFARAMQAEARRSRLFILQGKRLSCNSLLIVISSSSSVLLGRRTTSSRISRGFSCTTRRSTTFAPRWHAERLVGFLASSSTGENSSRKHLQGRRLPFRSQSRRDTYSFGRRVRLRSSVTNRSVQRKERAACTEDVTCCMCLRDYHYVNRLNEPRVRGPYVTDCCGMWAKREQRSKVMSRCFSYQSNDDAKIIVDAAIQQDGRSHCPRK